MNVFLRASQLGWVLLVALPLLSSARAQEKTVASATDLPSDFFDRLRHKSEDADLPRRREQQQRCADDPTYTGRWNIECSLIAREQLNCQNFRLMAYTEEEIDELLRACPVACNEPCPEPTPSAPTQNLTAYPTSNPTSTPVTSTFKKDMLKAMDDMGRNKYQLHNGISSTTDDGMCFEDRCQDDDTYLSPFGTTCGDHFGTMSSCFVDWLKNGSKLQVGGEQPYFVQVSSNDLWDLVVACPCTCNADCGNKRLRVGSRHRTEAASLTPSSSPSNRPSDAPTDVPTSQPSISFSSFPSISPSSRPSSTPTLRGTISPSHSPSFSPTTIQTSTPSATPSLAPSISPSIGSTILHSSAPSDSPSESATESVPPLPYFEVNARSRTDFANEDKEETSLFHPFDFTFIAIIVASAGSFIAAFTTVGYALHIRRKRRSNLIEEMSTADHKICQLRDPEDGRNESPGTIGSSSSINSGILKPTQLYSVGLKSAGSHGVEGRSVVSSLGVGSGFLSAHDIESDFENSRNLGPVASADHSVSKKDKKENAIDEMVDAVGEAIFDNKIMNALISKKEGNDKNKKKWGDGDSEANSDSEKEGENQLDDDRNYVSPDVDDDEYDRDSFFDLDDYQGYLEFKKQRQEMKRNKDETSACTPRRQNTASHRGTLPSDEKVRSRGDKRVIRSHTRKGKTGMSDWRVRTRRTTDM